jgi:hypothetical protein
MAREAEKLLGSKDEKLKKAVSLIGCGSFGTRES